MTEELKTGDERCTLDQKHHNLELFTLSCVHTRGLRRSCLQGQGDKTSVSERDRRIANGHVNHSASSPAVAPEGFG